MATLAPTLPRSSRGGPYALFARASGKMLRPGLILLVQQLGIGAVFFPLIAFGGGRFSLDRLLRIP